MDTLFKARTMAHAYVGRYIMIMHVYIYIYTHTHIARTNRRLIRISKDVSYSVISRLQCYTYIVCIIYMVPIEPVVSCYRIHIVHKRKINNPAPIRVPHHAVTTGRTDTLKRVQLQLHNNYNGVIVVTTCNPW